MFDETSQHLHIQKELFQVVQWQKATTHPITL